MTSDVSGRPLLFGGCCWTYGGLNDTSRWTGGPWKRLHRATTWGSGLYPAGREGASMAFDAAKGQVVLFGGFEGTRNKLLRDTWTWNGTTWTQRRPPTSPSARWFATMGYNPKTRQVVLFGGVGNSDDGSDGETWTWDGSVWTQRHPSNSPSPRIAGTMADDAAGNTVLFGGIGCDATSCTTPNDTWTWDGTNWTQRFSPLSPSGRVQASMATDRARNRVLLFGGTNRTQGRLSDTWTWDGSAWSPQLPVSSPPRRQGAGMAYDATTKRVVLFGGLEDCCNLGEDTWTWDGTTWSEVRRTWPQADIYPAGTYDAARGQAVLFEVGPAICGDAFVGQPSCRGDTWTWNGSSWTNHPVGNPPALRSTALAFDAARANAVLFGGYPYDTPLTGSVDSGDTWTWDGTAWTKRNPQHSPPPRRDAAIAYDARRGKVVLFGGVSWSRGRPPVQLGDTWTWDGTDWRQERPSKSPAARAGARMAYDEANGQVVLFGGDANGLGNGGCLPGDCRTFDDTWTWNGRDWTRRHTTSSPGPRSEYALGYDRPSRTVVLFGGMSTPISGQFPTFYNDTWTWNGSTWTLRSAGSSTPSLSVRGRPSGRAFAAVVADRLGRMVVFGGHEYSRPVNDIWTYGGG